MIELPQGYYLTNFLELVDYVYEQYNDLLNKQETEFYLNFKSLTKEAQFLYVRMLTRKGLVFRESKLNYQEIKDIQSASKTLSKASLVELNPPLAAESLIPVFSKPEWISILKQLELDKETIVSIKKLSRGALDEMLIELDKEFDLYTLIDEPIILLSQFEAFETFKLLFFGNLNQDLTDFVLRDLGLYRFESYQIDRNSRLFSSREQIENYLNYYQVLEGLDEALQGDCKAIINFHQLLPQVEATDNTLMRRVQRVNISLARQLERLASLDQALSIYRENSLEPSRERQARILLKQNKVDRSLEICQQIINAPRSESELIFAQEFGFRAAKKHKIKWPQPDGYKPPQETISIPQTEDNVEISARQYFSQYGECFYIENGLFLSVFGLHYWPLFFAPIKGAFTNPFQFRPHDLYEDDFLKKRQDIYQKLSLTVDNMQDNIENYLNRISEKQGTSTPFVFWELLTKDLLEFAFEHIPGTHWKQIFDRIFLDIKANRSGFPDLILFPAEGGYELIEIKGPGDKLQKNQLRWMKYFAKHDIPHKVVNVEWQ
ncbi:VRR-NUC domain-containing protein [Aliikangiella marina]|uniref:phosphodiesterase I n=1 Tax=Aliikangiella marina TaxID=1712262 RepID=A0A545T6F9_9GAMM|nr:VRR-NUC domain-containing protein [Aliikangiella marina]TQV72809.1 VRR-NUC domain-containing protein [Aliikangiella marina]